ncbi:TatD family hydrolase [Tenuibacillus multivorans]|uniref:TatD DNase family protein n=1 Tax=Tenuibacillus multivorans TaxID=237069 RepID=A0A1H0DTX5_9BACI|nr:TatD family hydrolase [Tenuibacillus multivorans]GEL76782.1 hypothetical protein TMU01_10170 [Tenuibacillus multivorans]SDN73528.1 TatD DNase family protein [Tenuibacillus multivorans]
MHQPIIDSHIHFDLYKEDEKRHILKVMEAYKVTDLISVSRHAQSAQENIELAKQDERVKVSIGYHPEQKLPNQNEVDKLFELIDGYQDEIVAIGEVGLPYYMRKDNRSIKVEPYLNLLEKFVQKAKELDLPIVLHAIYEDAPIVCDLLEQYSVTKAHFHWFKGDAKTVKRMIDHHYFISITPDVLYEAEIQSLVQSYPLSKMMVETDGPWPFEGPFQGQMTHPKMIHETVMKIAELKQCEVAYIYENLFQNTKDFYKII